MVLMLNPAILEASKKYSSPADGQALHISGKAPQSFNFTELNKIATNLTTLAQEQKRTGSPSIRVTNDLISELSNTASLGTVQANTALFELSSKVNSALDSIVSKPAVNSGIDTYQPRRDSRNSVFASNATNNVSDIQTHEVYQKETLIDRTQPNIESNPIVDDGSLGGLLDSFGIDPATAVDANGEFSFTKFAKENPLLIGGGLLVFLMLMTRGKRR